MRIHYRYIPIPRENPFIDILNFFSFISPHVYRITYIEGFRALQVLSTAGSIYFYIAYIFFILTFTNLI